jgi:hypothetical protein
MCLLKHLHSLKAKTFVVFISKLGSEHLRMGLVGPNFEIYFQNEFGQIWEIDPRVTLLKSRQLEDVSNESKEGG